MRRAFTLIELLVVVAILALLIAMLIPALGQARRVARVAVCLTHVRGMAQVLQLYANDNKDVLPWNNNGATPGHPEIDPAGGLWGGAYWVQHLTSNAGGSPGYVKADAKPGGPFNCPLFANDPPPGPLAWAAPSNTTCQIGANVNLILHVNNDLGGTQANPIAGAQLAAWLAGLKWVKMTPLPADIVLDGDTTTWDPTSWTTGVPQYYVDDAGSRIAAEITVGAVTPWPVARLDRGPVEAAIAGQIPRHNGRVNLAFIDGHAEGDKGQITPGQRWTAKRFK